MDVAKPGESAPDISARPVLVTHRPIVQDPMVKDEKTSDDPADAKLDTLAHSQKVIQPVSAEVAEAQTEKPAEPAAETSAEPEKSAQESSPPENAEAATASSETAVVEAVADQATEDKKKENKLSDEEKAKQAAVQKLVDEKKYFVPIGQVGRRRNRRVLVAAAVVLVLLAGAYLAVDADVVDVNINLPVNLIKN